MGATIDERVVEMRFDNKQFEQTAKQTMSTLDRLKKALDFTESGKSLDNLDQAVKSVSFDGMAAGIEALQKRFSTLGIVGMRIIENLTDSVMNKLGSALNFIQEGIVSGGLKRAMNLEKAHFQLQNIIGDEERVQAVMAKANESVDGTAYSFDVAAKASSQFYASGITDLDQMGSALKGLAGTTATFSADYEQMALIWTQVAGQGRLMGDQLLQLSTRGANAAVTIADFMNGVNSGAIQASDSVTSAVRAISTATNLTEADIRDLTSEGEINFAIFAEAMSYTFGDAAKKANETFDGALANIKSALARIGAGFISPLIAQNSEIVRLFNSVRERVNDVKKALVFDEEIGNVHALSKQFTDSVLSMAGSLADWLTNLDVSKPMEAFYYGVESIKNVAKGIGDILKPIGTAFRDVFLSFSINDVVNLAAAVERFTSNLRMTDRASKGLHDALEGVFSVVKLLVDGFLGLFGITVQIGRPINSLAEWLLVAAGSMGRALTSFTKWVRESPLIQRSFNSVSESVRNVMRWLGDFIRNIDQFIIKVKELPAVQKAFAAINTVLIELGKIATPYINKAANALKKLKDVGKNFITENMLSLSKRFETSMKNLSDSISRVDLTSIQDGVRKLTKRFEGFFDIFKRNKSIEEFTDNMGKWNSTLKDDYVLTTFSSSVDKASNSMDGFKKSFSFDSVISNIESFKSTVQGLIDWIVKNVGPTFSGFSVGGVVAAGGGFAMIYGFIKMAKAFTQIANSLRVIPGILGGIPRVLNSLNLALRAYQDNLRADSILKIAKAIGVLALALIGLSFTDINKLAGAALVLGIFAKVLMEASSDLLDSIKKTREASDALFEVGKGIKKALNNLTKAVKWKSIGSAIKNLGITIALITASIAGLAYLYSKDSTSVQGALKIIGEIAGVLVAIIAVLSIMGQKISKGMNAFSKAAAGVALLGLSLSTIIGALSKLLKLELPEDYKTKLGILAEILLGVAGLNLTVGIASRISGGSKLSASAIILASCISMTTVVHALQKLFEMDLPKDYKTKLGILGGIFVGLAGLITTIGFVSRIAGGKIKAIGTILAMCAFVSSVVIALMILSIFPGDKLLNGTIALGTVLVALAVALAGASKISNSANFKPILAMAAILGGITAALGILSLIAWPKLIKAAAALGMVLLALAVDLKAAGSIADGKAFATIAAMVASILVIAGSLAILATHPWENLLASSAAMSATILAFAELMRRISKSSGIKPEKIALFLAATLSLIPIGLALYQLAKQPWQGMLASATAISAVLLSFTAALKVISALKGIKPEKIALFLAATLSLIPIGLALYQLAKQPWQSLIAAGAAISEVLIVFAAVFVLVSKIKPNLSSIGVLIAGVVAIGAVAIALNALADHDWQNLLAAGAAISLVLLAMSAAMGVAALVGTAAGPALAGLALLDLFIADMALVLVALGKIFEDPNAQRLLSGGAGVLVQIGEAIGGFVGSIVGSALSKISESFVDIGENLSKFMEAAQPFFDGATHIDESATNGVKNLAIAMLAMTAADILNGVTSWLTGGSSFVEFGKELAEFAPYLSDYYNNIKGIDGGIIEASANAALALAEMANKLPNSGGLSGKIFGENNLSDFGAELKKFGPLLSEYAESVANVNAEAVTASANAAQVMADMASKLPNSGGLAAKILGDNTLSAFGEELKKFGPSFADYAASVAGIDGGVVEASANAAMALSNLANNLPNTGGLVSFFTGDNSIEDFGKQLSKFGGGLLAYYLSISPISFDQVNSATDSMTKIIEMARGASGVDGKDITKIIENLKKAAQTGITDFVSAFQNAGPQVTAAISTFITIAANAIQAQNPIFQAKGLLSANSYILGIRNKFNEAGTTGQTLAVRVITALQNKVSQFTQKGTASASGYLQGFKNKYGEASSTGQTLANNVLTALQNKVGEFTTKGSSSGSNYVSGVSSKAGDAASAGRRLGSNAVDGAASGSDGMYDVGRDAGRGFVNGLDSMLGEASSAGRSIGRAAYNAARSALDEHSPSKKMGEVGEFAGIGFVQRLLFYVTKSEEAGSAIGDATLRGLRTAISNITNAVDSGIEIEPVITPVVDLTNVNRSADEISKKFNDAIRLTTQTAQEVSFGVQRRNNVSSESDIRGSEGSTTIFEFNQTNNSPKPLSRIDIYRSTRNQFTQFQEVVNSNKT